MKFVRFNGGRTGIVAGAGDLRIIDIEASHAAFARVDAQAAATIGAVLLNDAARSWVPMIGQWDAARSAFASLERTPPEQLSCLAYAQVALEPPLASPAIRIFALGSNTTDHIIRAFKVMINADLTPEQARQPKQDGTPPFGFMLWPSTVVGPDATVAPPRGTQTFDYEAECAVYVKDGGRYLPSVAIWGYTAFNDLGVRDSHLGLAKAGQPGPFSLNIPKNFDSSNACGPWVAVDECDDLSTLRCRLSVNGAARQDWQLSEMIYGFDETLAYLSNSLTLRPGDMLASGTGAGVALESGVAGDRWLKPGDQIEITLDGIGPLRNTVGSW